MTFDKFVKRNRLISEHMQRIANSANITATASWIDAKALMNPLFRDVFAAQERLLIAAEELLETTGLFEIVAPTEE